MAIFSDKSVKLNDDLLFLKQLDKWKYNEQSKEIKQGEYNEQSKEIEQGKYNEQSKEIEQGELDNSVLSDKKELPNEIIIELSNEMKYQDLIIELSNEMKQQDLIIELPTNIITNIQNILKTIKKLYNINEQYFYFDKINSKKYYNDIFFEILL